MNANILIETENLSKEEWLRVRKHGLGGSDISILLGINPWRSELELWLDKTNQTNESVAENEAMYFGSLLEPLLREEFTKRTGRKVVELKAILQHNEYSFMIADVDGITQDDEGNPAILELKTASEYKRSEWEQGVPNYYLTQVQHYLAVTGLKKAFVGVLIGGNTFVVREVDADIEIQEMLIALEKDFWNKVTNMIRPDIGNSDAAKRLLDSIYSGGVEEQLVLPEDAIEYVDMYIEATADMDSAKARQQEASNHLKEFLADYNSAKCLGHTINWKPVSTQRIDTKALAEKYPEIAEKFTKTTVSRRFTLR